MFDFVDNGMILARIFVNQTYYIESKNIVSNGFSANRFTTLAIAPEFGNVSAGELVFTIDKSTTCFNILLQTEIPATINKGDSLDVMVYLESNPQTSTYIGGYIVTDVTETEGKMTATCLDKMIYLDTEADLSNVTYPISAEDFIYAVFHNGSTQFFDISENVYKEVMLDDPVFEQGTTYRQVLSKVCECMGACAWATGSGESLNVSIDFYSEVEAEIDNTKYISADITPHGYNVRVEVTDDISALPVEITTINEETFLIMRIVANPFFANKTAQQREDIADVIMGNIGEQIWYGANITVLPMPDLLPYMIVTVDGKAVPITNITYGLNENTKIESKITTDNNTYNYSVSRDIAKVKQEVKGLEENNKHFFYRDDSGVHITMVENDYDTGNNIHIDSDSVDVRQGTDVVASFGASTRVGEAGKSNVELTSSGMTASDESGTVVFRVQTGGNLRTWITQSGDVSLTLNVTVELQRTPVVSQDYPIIVEPISSTPAILQFAKGEIERADVWYEVASTYRTKYDSNSNSVIIEMGSQYIRGYEIQYCTLLPSRVVSIQGDPPQLSLKNNLGGATSYIRAYEAGAYGNNVVFQSGGHMIIGGGEYAQNLYNAGILKDDIYGRASDLENLFLGADKRVFIESNANTIGNRYTWVFDSDGIFKSGGIEVSGYLNVREEIFGSGDIYAMGNANISGYIRVSGGGVGEGGLRTTDSVNHEYPLIKDNGTDLWIGAEQTASQHHRGRTYISTGYNGTNGNESVYVSVPNANNDGGTAYQVLHTGNYPKYLDYNAGETVTLSALTGTGYSTGTSGTYYLFLDTPKQVPSGKTLTVTSITATIRGVNGVVVSNTDVLSNVSNMLRASNGKPRILLTGLTNNFKANTPAHIVCTVTFTIAS